MLWADRPALALRQRAAFGWRGWCVASAADVAGVTSAAGVERRGASAVGVADADSVAGVAAVELLSLLTCGSAAAT